MSEAGLQLNDLVPDFRLPASGGEEIALSNYRGSKVVLYFYPKNMTPACTQEACDFRDRTAELRALGAVVLGISTDPVSSHDRFRDKQSLSFPLLSDGDHQVCQLFGVWQVKKMYGREYEGIVRSTFLIDEEGRLVKEWRKVRVKGHADEVVEAVKSLAAN